MPKSANLTYSKDFCRFVCTEIMSDY